MRPLLIALALSACGTDPNQTPDKNKPWAQEGSIQYASPEPKTVTVEYRKDGDNIETVVTDTGQLPECTYLSAGKLAWDKASNKHFKCQGENWVEVASTLPPESPSKVPSPQPTPTRRAPPDPVASTQWVDPITATQWLLASEETQATVDAYPPCDPPYRLGTVAETREAIQHGLSLASAHIGLSGNLWTSDTEIQANGSYSRLSVTPEGIPTPSLALPSLATPAQAGIACLRDRSL